MPSSPVLLITGGNAGLGFQIVKALCNSSVDYTILLGGRNLQKAAAAAQGLKNVTPIQIDIEDDDSINNAFKHVSEKYGRLDILINNAGGQFDPDTSLSMRELWNKSWNVNTTSTQIITHTFLPLLLKSSDPRLIFITSGTSTMGEHENTALFVNKSPPQGWPKTSMTGVPAYRSSKTGMNMMMREWVRLLKEDGVKLWCISPGFLATGLGGNQEANKAAGAQDPTIGAEFIRSVVEGARDADVGKVIRKDNIQPW